MPANILNLPCYKVRGIQENEHDYHVEVETVESPAACPHCQSANLVGFGRREQMVKDLPMHGRRVGLYIDTRRYQCRGCGVLAGGRVHQGGLLRGTVLLSQRLLGAFQIHHELVCLQAWHPGPVPWRCGCHDMAG